MQYEKHYQESISLSVSAEDVFDYIDDHSNYYSHVIEFAKLVGGRMALQFDDGRGKSVGSRILLSGNIFGKALSLEEVVTKREPPRIKTWETVGTPRFFIVGRYQYNVFIKSQDKGCDLTISFEFSPPDKSGWLRRYLSNLYARVCAREMVMVTRKNFVKRR